MCLLVKIIDWFFSGLGTTIGWRRWNWQSPMKLGIFFSILKRWIDHSSEVRMRYNGRSRENRNVRTGGKSIKGRRRRRKCRVKPRPLKHSSPTCQTESGTTMSSIGIPPLFSDPKWIGQSTISYRRRLSKKRSGIECQRIHWWSGKNDGVVKCIIGGSIIRKNLYKVVIGWQRTDCAPSPPTFRSY